MVYELTLGRYESTTPGALTCPYARIDGGAGARLGCLGMDATNCHESSAATAAPIQTLGVGPLPGHFGRAHPGRAAHVVTLANWGTVCQGTRGAA